ncbi:MAG TPA: hypothetical protein DD672_12295 [Gammaproteobacteria bacterium]|nr:hypothetical protein [Gammaproteobacteria bacterium]HCA37992.1 hypothetical protein [Gammaproteobacteria bacterium]
MAIFLWQDCAAASQSKNWKFTLSKKATGVASLQESPCSGARIRVSSFFRRVYRCILAAFFATGDLNASMFIPKLLKTQENR